MMRMPAFAMVVLGVISSITSHSWSFGEYLPTTTMYESCSWFTGGEKEALRCLFSHLSPTFCGNLAISPPRGSLKMSFQTSRERWPLLFPYKRLYFWVKITAVHRLTDSTTSPTDSSSKRGLWSWIRWHRFGFRQDFTAEHISAHLLKGSVKLKDCLCG